jgi:hypothetical protein
MQDLRTKYVENMVHARNMVNNLLVLLHLQGSVDNSIIDRISKLMFITFREKFVGVTSHTPRIYFS